MPSDSTLPPILVAEDDPNDLFLFQQALIAVGAKHPITHFGNGAEVIQFLREICLTSVGREQTLPRLLFLDLHLPQIDGCGVLAWARKQKALANLRIVVVSGSGDSKDVERAKALGADQILIKPAPTAALLAEIARLNQSLPLANDATIA